MFILGSFRRYQFKIQKWKRIIDKNSVDVDCVIASSTGTNFDCQLRKNCKPNYINWF